jgi:adenine-specific DNA-methyltransferase
MSKYNDLVSKLREIFQLDSPDLDFGIYKIINQRAALINDYLDNRLKEKVTAALAAKAAADTATEREELTSRIRDEYGKRAFDEAGHLVLKEAAASEYGTRLASLEKDTATDADHENAVFSHLLTFFSRYYDNGDFISQRRYKGDTYAIPYAGEEVVLYWANKDQYYTKSGENFANYTFTLDDGRKVHLRLVTADTAKDNRKDTATERRYRLVTPALEAEASLAPEDADAPPPREPRIPIEEAGEDGNELILRFEYAAMPKGTKQADLTKEVIATVLADDAVKTRWLDLARRVPTEANPGRTLLQKHIEAYTAKNSADYFIHKDLGKFLKRELDFYIKTEVMNLDDVQHAAAFAAIEKNLRMIQCLRAIATELIEFLAQIENFQKKLWLKKKFVTETNYCITLDRVPETLYPEIAANDRQWAEWAKLGFLSGGTASAPSVAGDGELPLDDQPAPPEQGTVEYLKANPYLVLDTAFFDAAFKQQLLASIDNIDEQCDGLLIHSENFQALNLLQDRYREQVKCVYIDPPYNTDATAILYKNGYKDSSWMSLIRDRLAVGKDLLRIDGVHCLTIDDYEHAQVRQILEAVFGEDNYLATVLIRNNPSGRSTVKGFSINHEFALFYGVSPSTAKVGRLPHSEAQKTRYDIADDRGEFEWENFRKSSAGSDRNSRPKQHFPLFVNRETLTIRVPNCIWLNSTKEYDVCDKPQPSEDTVWPLDSGSNEKVWRWGIERTLAELYNLQARFVKNRIEVYGKKYRNDAGILPRTWWDKPEYSARDNGTRVLRDQLGRTSGFDFPKAVSAVSDCIRVGGAAGDGIILDYFGGSATTGHAVIDLNREDDGGRKYVLVEMGAHFDTVLKPRIQKVVYSKDWKDGKPTAPETGISHCFKYIRLESYEDTLNNIALQAPEGDLFTDNTREDFLLHYMLDVESRGSLLSVEDFKKPFDYALKIAVDSAGATERRPVDLVETFNYLIGLRVAHIKADLERGFILVEGALPTGESTLVLWRDCEKIDYEELDKLCRQLKLNPKDSEYDVVYINGDHNIPALAQETESEGGITRQLKLRQIEPEFLTRMFAVEDV